MAETIIAGGCVAIVCSAWYPWYWTKSWGANGCFPDRTHLHCDCGWAASTYNEVHALTLERQPQPHDTPSRSDHDPEARPDQKLPGSDDIVSEQYTSIRTMYVRRDGLVVNLVPQEELEASRSTAGNVKVGDALRKNKDAEMGDILALPERTRDRLLKMQESLKINDRIKKLGTLRRHKDSNKGEDRLVAVEEVELEERHPPEIMKRSVSTENLTLVEDVAEGKQARRNNEDVS